MQVYLLKTMMDNDKCRKFECDQTNQTHVEDSECFQGSAKFGMTFNALEIHYTRLLH